VGDGAGDRLAACDARRTGCAGQRRPNWNRSQTARKFRPVPPPCRTAQGEPRDVTPGEAAGGAAAGRFVRLRHGLGGRAHQHRRQTPAGALRKDRTSARRGKQVQSHGGRLGMKAGEEAAVAGEESDRSRVVQRQRRSQGSQRCPTRESMDGSARRGRSRRSVPLDGDPASTLVPEFAIIEIRRDEADCWSMLSSKSISWSLVSW
jgi:hypothetical protein